VLRQDRDALHVKLVAPVAFRVEAVAARDGVDRAEALARVRESDANRQRYHQQHYRRDWNDASAYHLTLNTGLLGVADAVRIVVAEANRKWGMRLAANA
jgi:CMP/dCMP kinase